MLDAPLTARTDVVYRGIYTVADPGRHMGASADVYATTSDGQQRVVSAKESHDIERRSEDFEWGYKGAGPYQLAVGLLTDVLRLSGVTDPAQIRRVLDIDCKHGPSIPRQFADDVTCDLPKYEQWTLTRYSIADYINARGRERDFERRLTEYFTQQMSNPDFVEGIPARMARLAMLDRSEVIADFEERVAALADESFEDADSGVVTPAGPGMG